VTVGNFIRGSNFNNNTFYVTTVTIPNFAPTSAGTLRIQCDASDNTDQVFIDAVTITSINGPALIESNVTIEEVPGPVNFSFQQLNNDQEKELTVYPNPVKDILNIAFNGEIQSVRIVSLDGRDVKIGETNLSGNMLDISSLSPGIYFISVQSEGEWYPTKFSKM
jgi:hypothetical protein